MDPNMDSDSFGAQDPSRDIDSTEAWSGFNQGSGSSGSLADAVGAQDPSRDIDSAEAWSGFNQGSGSSGSLADAVPQFFNFGLRDLGTRDGGDLVSTVGRNNNPL